MSENVPTRLLHTLPSNVSLVGLQKLGQYLTDRGHAPSTIGKYLKCVGHFERWRGSSFPEGAAIDETSVALFLKNHLPSCSCPSPGPRSRKEARAALNHYLAVLWKHDLIGPPRTAPLSHVEKEVQSFDRYLVETCGVAVETRNYRRRYVREFLAVKYGPRPVNPLSLSPGEVMSFLTERAAIYKPGTSKVIAASIRSYLKFLVLRGIFTNRILAAVPTIPQWRLSSIPKVLSVSELERFLSSFDGQTATGRRNYAMALCIAELGLRTSEVAQLSLDDLNWRAGTVRIVGKKSHCERILPLTCRVGGAIADYLKRDRPKVSERSLFLRQGLLEGTPVTCNIVRGVVTRTCAHAGILPPKDCPHTFRHTLATRLLGSGVPLTGVADVLGHRCVETTTIYTKVDLGMLSQVAMPWPEVAS